MFLTVTALEIIKGNYDDRLVMADWLMENREPSEDLETHIGRLRHNVSKLRVESVFEIVAKYGTKFERKRIGRVRRLLVDSFNFHEGASFKDLPDLVSLESRQKINARRKRAFTETAFSVRARKVAMKKVRVATSPTFYRVMATELLELVVKERVG